MIYRKDKYNNLKKLIGDGEKQKELLTYLRMYPIDYIVFYGRPIFLCNQLSKARCNKPTDFEKRFLPSLDTEKLKDLLIVSFTGFELKEFRREWTIQSNFDLPHKDYKLLVCDWKAALEYLLSYVSKEESKVIAPPIGLNISNVMNKTISENENIRLEEETNHLTYQIKSYDWRGQQWFIGLDLSVLCGRQESHFKDYPRSLKRKGITEGYLKLIKDELKEFKSIVQKQGGSKYRNGSCLLICNYDVAKLYLDTYCPKENQKILAKRIFESKPSVVYNSNLVVAEQPRYTKANVVDTVVDKIKANGEEPYIIFNTEISPEFKEYIDKYNLKHVVWNYQPWFVGSQLSRVISKDKYHFNYFGNSNRGSVDIKCMLLKGPALTQFKQAVENSLSEADKEAIGDIKFYTGLFVCDWQAALKYLKQNETLEQSLVVDKTIVDYKDLLEDLYSIGSELKRISNSFLDRLDNLSKFLK